MELPKQEYWSGLPFPPPGDLSDPGIELASPMSPAVQADFSTLELLGKPYNKSHIFNSNSRSISIKGLTPLLEPDQYNYKVGKKGKNMKDM